MFIIKNKKMYFIISILAIILILMLSIDMHDKAILSSDSIMYTDIGITTEALDLKGIIISSIGNLKEYDYELKGYKLYLTLYQGSLENKPRNVKISIEDDFSKVEEIYQLNMNGEYDLIWSKN